MKAMIDATFVKEAAANRKSGKGVDPFVARDPWLGGQPWEAWNAHQSSTASSSGSATTGQGDTSQALRGKWHPQGEMARAAVGGASDKFHQKQTAVAGHLEHVPAQVFIRGWSNFGENGGITKARTTEIWGAIRAELTQDVERLITHFTMFEPIQRIAIHVMERTGVATHVRDSIQQAVGKLSLQQDGKDLQIVIQKPPEVRKMSGQLSEKQMEIKEFCKTGDEIRPVWSDHSLKGPGGVVLGRIDNNGIWKWSPKNIEKALKVSESSVTDFLAGQSLDWYGGARQNSTFTKVQLRVVNWNIRRLSLAGFEDLHDAVTKSSERLQMDDWDVLCLQEPGMMMPPEHMHKQFKCDRKAGWGASIIVHERFVNRVTFNATGTNWVVVGLDFSDRGWRDVGVVSAHLPPRKLKKELDDSEYYGTIVDYADAVKRLQKQMPTARVMECIDANVELPHLDDMTHTLTGELCNRHGINSRAIELLEHLHENNFRAINTWPCESHATRDEAWTCLGARGEQRLIDYICFEETLPYRVCHKEDVNTDHRAIHTAIPLAQEADLIQHVTFIKEKKRRRKTTETLGARH